MQIDGLTVVEVGGVSKTCDEHVFGKNPRWVVNLRNWGEAGVVKLGKDGKTGDRGATMMFISYPSLRESDSVRMWNPETNRVVTTRDVIWLHRMFFDPSRVSNINTFNEISEVNNSEADDDIVDEEAVSESNGWEGTKVDVPVLRYGRTIKPVNRLIKSISSMIESNSSIAVDLRYLERMAELDVMEVTALELSLVGAGVGGGFSNTSELKVLNFRQAMKGRDAKEWLKEVENEQNRFNKYNALTPVSQDLVPKDSKIMTTTWAMKKKANGTFRGCLNVRGYKQIDGMHYFGHNIAVPVANAITVQIVLVLFAMNPEWIVELIDVEGAFLQGKFADGEQMYIEIPDGFERFYGKDEVLKLNVPIYETKQAASCFYKTMVEKIKGRHYEGSKVDPCLYFCRRSGRMSLMISWVNDFMLLGTPDDVERMKSDSMSIFKCKPEGPLTEYVGSKIDITRKENGIARVKFTQPVLLQKLKDEFLIPIEGKNPLTPAVAGQVLLKGDGIGTVDPKEITEF